MKKIFTLILFVALVGFVAKAQDLTVMKTNMTPVCDGYIDDVDDPWGADWVELDNPSSGGTSNGDYSGQFKFLHNDTHLLLGVKVQDATGDGTAGNTYERDCIEIFNSMDDEINEDGT